MSLPAFACCTYFGGCAYCTRQPWLDGHLFVCCQCVTKELLSGSCAHLFWRDGRGSSLTWAESWPCDSAIPWVRGFTHSKGVYSVSQELHILTSVLFHPCCDINLEGAGWPGRDEGYWSKKKCPADKLKKVISPLPRVVLSSPLNGMALCHCLSHWGGGWLVVLV